MELLQKFAAVEVQTDRRIAETDKNYCEAAISSFQELAFFWEDMNKVQQELLGGKESSFSTTIWLLTTGRLFRKLRSTTTLKPCTKTLL